MTGEATIAITTIHAVREEHVPANTFMSFLSCPRYGCTLCSFSKEAAGRRGLSKKDGENSGL
jgi:hypothetical protein